jgi:ubiquinone/menaquinone biosynthesis C-methylase UbiE
VVADVGFGGGVGLKFLLDSVSRSACIHGVEVSDTMLKQAARRYRRDVAGGGWRCTTVRRPDCRSPTVP